MPLLPKAPTVLLHFNDAVGGQKDIVPSGTSVQGSVPVQVITTTLAALRNQTISLDNVVYKLDNSSFDMSNSFTLKYAEYITQSSPSGSATVTISAVADTGRAGLIAGYADGDRELLYVSSTGGDGVWDINGGSRALYEINVWTQWEIDYDAVNKKMYWFKNGEIVYSGACGVHPYFDPTKYTYINWWGGYKGSKKGFIRNLDFIAGTCVHTAAFTPDVLSQDTMVTITNIAPFLSSSTKVFGTSSFEMNGSNYIKLPNNILDTTRDFTISFWEHVTSATSSAASFSANNASPGSASGGLMVGYNYGTKMLYASSSVNGSWDLINSASLGSIDLNTWVHWEVDYVDSSRTLYAFKNGALVYKTVLTARIGCGSTGQCEFGAWGGNIEAGYLDECMILNGKCLHTADFNVPTDEYFVDTYYLVRQNDNTFYRITSGDLTPVGTATDGASIKALFLANGSYSTATKAQVDKIDTGANHPRNVCWQGTVGEDVPSSTVVAAPAKAQFVYMNTDFQLTKMSNVDWFKVNNGTVNAEVGAGKLRHVVSRDSGKTWWAYTDGTWAQVIDMSSSSTADGALDANGRFVLNDAALAKVLAGGMAAADFAVVPWNEWTLADGYKQIRFGCVLSVDAVADVALMDNIQYQYDGMGKWALATNRVDYEVRTDNSSHAIKWLTGISGKRVKVNY